MTTVARTAPAGPEANGEQPDIEALTDRFESGEIDPGRFDHHAHVAVAWTLLGRRTFLDAAVLYARTIETIATRAGAHDKFNLTITIAFLSLIAERRQAGGETRFADFVAANADLLESSILTRWYSPDRLMSPGARQVFLLPDEVLPDEALPDEVAPLPEAR